MAAKRHKKPKKDTEPTGGLERQTNSQQGHKGRKDKDLLAVGRISLNSGEDSSFWALLLAAGTVCFFCAFWAFSRLLVSSLLWSGSLRGICILAW